MKTVRSRVQYIDMFFGKNLRFIRDIVSKNKLATFIFLIAVFLRFVNLEPFVTFLGDQGRDAIIVKRIITFEHLPAIGPTMSIGGVFLGPFFYYLMAPFLFISNFHPVGMAIGVALLSIIGIIGAYFIVKKLTSTIPALIFLILISFSSVNIEFARFSWNPNLLPVSTFFTLYFFYRTITNRGFLDAFLFGSFFSFSIQFHYLAILALTPILILSATHLLEKKNRVTFIKNLGMAVVAFCLFLSPFILFEIKNNFLNTRNAFKFFSEKETGQTEPYFSATVSTAQSFFSHIIKYQLNREIAVGIFVLLIILLLIIRKDVLKKNAFFRLHFLHFILYMLLFSFLSHFRYPHYFGPVYFSFFVILGILLDQYIQNKFIPRMILIILLGIYIAFNAKYYTHLQGEGNRQIQRAQIIAGSILRRNPTPPYQLTALPYTEIDGHVRYFLEINGKRPLSEDTVEEPKELYVLCYYPQCDVLNHPQWQIASFKNKKIATIWEVLGIKIYKVIHEK